MQAHLIFIVIFAAGTLLSPFSCFAESPEADAIGDIVTINDAQASAEAVAIKDGKVLAVSNLSEIERADKGALTRAIDLAGRTLLPSFIDA
jgi:hypothetical protein